MLKTLSINQLLLLAFMLVGLLPAIIVSFSSFYPAQEALKTEITHDLQILSEAVASDVERLMFERVQNVNSWSQLAIMQDLQIGDIDKRLSIFLNETQKSYQKTYVALHVLNQQNLVVASSQAYQIGQKYPQPVFWFEIQTGKQPLQIHHLNQDKLVLSQAIIDNQSNQLIGRFIAELNWKVINDLLNDAVKETAAVALLDSKSHVMASSSNWNKQSKVIQANAHFKGQFQFPNWQVSVQKAKSLVTAPVRRLAWIFLLLLLGTLVFSVFMMRLISRAITRPLSQLTTYVKQFHFYKKTTPPKQGPPEFLALSEAFEKMIDDLAQSESQLTRAAKLAVVGEMAAAMSHEVRTPLGIMRSSSDVLLREPNLSQDGKEVLGFIISETERLNKLVSSLIDAARPRELNLITLNLTQHIHKVIAILNSQAQAKRIKIEFSQQSQILINADQDQMTQVLMNLMMNAIQILPEGGKIAMDCQVQGDQVVLTVSDDGPGVPAENQTQMFEAFFTQRAGGVGLGLAVVRQIIQAHRGEISYQTSQWQGAQFTIKLPLN